MPKKGLYIVIEGSDGIGKTTQARDMLIPKLKESGINAIYAHEPGGTQMGEEIESILKERRLNRHPMTNLLLFTAARIEAWYSLIKPSIDSGCWVIADRNWLSSAVYQGYAEGLGIKKVHEITRNSLPAEYMYPDLTIFAEADASQQIRLLESRGKSQQDYFESKKDSFQNNLRSGYKKIAADPIIRSDVVMNEVIKLSFNGTQQEVHQRVMETIASRMTNVL